MPSPDQCKMGTKIHKEKIKEEQGENTILEKCIVCGNWIDLNIDNYDIVGGSIVCEACLEDKGVFDED